MKAIGLVLASFITLFSAGSCLAAGVVVEIQDAPGSDSDIQSYSDKLATRIESQWRQNARRVKMPRLSL